MIKKFNSKRRPDEVNYGDLFNSMKDGFASCKMIYGKTGKVLDATFLYVNPAFSTQVGLSADEIIGHTIKKVLPDLKTFLTEICNLVVQTNSNEHCEDTFTLHNRKFNIKVWKSDVGRLAMIFEDITDRKNIEKTTRSENRKLNRLRRSQEDIKQALFNVMDDLEEANARLELEKVKDEAMLASIGEGLIAVDKDKKFILINKKAEEIFGIKAKALLQQKTIDIIPIEDDQGNPIPTDERPTHIAIITGNVITSNKYVIVNSNGTRIPIALTVTPLKVDNKIIGAISVFRDIMIEQEIDRAKTEFVSIASHQLRTPLGIIKWYIEAIKSREYIKQAPESIKKYFKEIEKSNVKLLNLVRDLLSVSRIDQGKIKNFPKETDAVKTIKQIVKECRLLASKSRITISIKVKNDIPLIFIDSERFTEVIQNFITNAIYYNHKNGKIFIELSSDPKRLVISIRDTGIGIAKENIKHLFVKFYRTEQATTYYSSGTGLGLYVAKSYIDSWGGKIDTKSVLGKGTTFTITLPVLRRE